MVQPVVVIEAATPQNFNEEGYLLANPDVAAYVRAGGDARRHFDQHGVHEGRRLITRGFLDRRAERGRRKYERFAAVLNPKFGAGGAFRYVVQQKSFPVYFGEKPYDIATYGTESANPGLGEFVREMQDHPERKYLDLGCGLRNFVFENCLYLEVYPALTADIIMEPACRYPIESASLDGISCLAVLEHVEQPWVVASEVRRMLKPGGLVFVDWPFLQPVHGYPSHFYNATRAGLKNMFSEGFEPITLDTFPNQTPDHTVNWIIREWSAALTSENARAELLAMTVAELLSQVPGNPFWQRMMAATPEPAKMTFACGNTLIARKL